MEKKVDKFFESQDKEFDKMFDEKEKYGDFGACGVERDVGWGIAKIYFNQ
jgi:hypothetical protein